MDFIIIGDNMTYHSNAPIKATISSATQLPIVQPFGDGKVASVMNPANHTFYGQNDNITYKPIRRHRL